MIICNRFSGWQQLIFKFFFLFSEEKQAASQHASNSGRLSLALHSLNQGLVRHLFLSFLLQIVVSHCHLFFIIYWTMNRATEYVLYDCCAWMDQLSLFLFHFTNQMRRYVPRMSEQVSPWIHYKLKQFNFLSNRGTYIYFWSNSKSDFMFF